MRSFSFIVLLVFLSFPALAGNELVETHAPVKLQRVIDGDTIEASGRTIRLWGIDAPETDTAPGPVATMLLESLINEGELRCKLIEQDRYSRDVMHCTIDGSDIGSLMVQMGMARDYSRYSGDYYQYEEDLARKEGRGIWEQQQSKDGFSDGNVPANDNEADKPETFGEPLTAPAKSCCKYCKKGKPCGNSCINRSYTCHKGPGCAC